MKWLTRGGFVFAVAIMLSTARPAQAQIKCDECDPQTSSCDEQCWWCGMDYEDPTYCDQAHTHYSTCGDYGGYTSGCLQCAPDFQEQSRVTQGTYGTTHYVFPNFYCEHHSVEWVTQLDVNHCNTNSTYWYHSYCHDEEDGYKFATHSVDCCDGNGPDGLPDSTFTCNHYHDCTG
jgi:hypothetical protein